MLGMGKTEDCGMQKPWMLGINNLEDAIAT
jgi:hypothetical protein